MADICRIKTAAPMTVQAQKKTFADLQALDLPEGDTGIYEPIQGEIVRRACPNTPHQQVALRLVRSLDRYNQEKKAAYLFFAPYDVYFDEHNAGIQPDVLWVRQARSIKVYVLENDRYRLTDYAAEEGTVASKVLEGLAVDVGAIFGHEN